MRRLTIEIDLISPTLIGSGTGFGSIIDSDIVFDETGVPYIPSKRIKGLLRDSAQEMLDAMNEAGIKWLSPEIIEKAFGRPGDEKPAPVYFSDLTIKDYDAVKKWLDYLSQKFNTYINSHSIMNFFTEIRQQTSIDEKKGTAEEHSLRTIRLAKKGLSFRGSIDIETNNEEIIKLLFVAAKNMRHMGTKRTRGYGSIRCSLFEGEKEINHLNELEGLCRK
jgi:CRISPR-associated protein Csx10